MKNGLEDTEQEGLSCQVNTGWVLPQLWIHFPPEQPVVAHLPSGKFLLMLDDANENPVNLEGAEHMASPTPTLD